MKKIPSLFKRDYAGTRLVYNEVVLGSEWVLSGEGVPTEKYDGTACMVRDGRLYRRYDRKPPKGIRRRHRDGELWDPSTFKSAPEGWEPCEDAPNVHTGHWPGWIPVGNGPEGLWHRAAWEDYDGYMPDGTYELVGPTIDGNPHGLENHEFWPHGDMQLLTAPRDYAGLKNWFAVNQVEGIVWWHPDGRMVKIKRRDFGYEWPPVEISGE